MMGALGDLCNIDVNSFFTAVHHKIYLQVKDPEKQPLPKKLGFRAKILCLIVRTQILHFCVQYLSIQILRPILIGINSSFCRRYL